MTGQSISTASGYATAYDAGVPLQSDPADIVQAFQEYHYGPGYTGSGSPTSGMEYHLGRKLDSSNPVGTGTLSINSSTSQILLKNAAAVTKGTITTNTGVITGSAADDLSLNTTGSKILLGINGTERVGITATATSVTGNLSVSGSAAFTGNVTAPTQASSDNSTKVATTAYVTGKDNTLYSTLYNDIYNSEERSYQAAALSGYATEFFQPHANFATVTTLGAAAAQITQTPGTGTPVTIISQTTARTSTTSPYKEIQYGTTATAGTAAGVRSNVLQHSPENSFQYYAHVLPSSIRPAALVRCFIGMTGSTTALPNSNVNNLTNSLGYGYDSGDTTYSFYSNDATGTGDKIDTFIPIATLDAVEVFISSIMGQIDCTLRVTDTAGTTIGQVVNSTISGNVNAPASNALMTWRAEIVNNATVIYAINVRRIFMRAPDRYSPFFLPNYPIDI